MASLSSPEGAGPCPICGGACQAFPDIEHTEQYPFLPGGRDPMADQDYIIAPHRIVDEELGRVMYGTGERVPMADAVKYGLVDKAEKVTAEKAAPRPKGKRAPAEDRAAKPAENRTRKAAKRK